MTEAFHIVKQLRWCTWLSRSPYTRKVSPNGASDLAENAGPSTGGVGDKSTIVRKVEARRKAGWVVKNKHTTAVESTERVHAFV